MNETAESLALPMETAPLIRMSQMSWPRIQYLSLKGRYPPEMQATTLPALLSRMPTLRSLHVQAAQRNTFSRPHIWDSSIAPSPSALSELESLTIAYPNPDDDIFAVKAPRLAHLSLRDEPRYYFQLRNQGYLPRSPAAPILSASECLHILRRMDTPALTSLELVYQADDAEDTLLRHLSSEYPALARLELHRYRERSDAVVPYGAIAEILSSTASIQAVHLNLDCAEMPPVHCKDYARIGSWTALSRSRTTEIVSAMRRCPKLKYIAVLDPRLQCCTWVDYCLYPSRDVWVDVDILERRADSDKLPFR
ncbi:hypothetical protein GY45DRAFT_1108179 [Cubamyces sp. BRFM 1775]|nr:hypothetical protein GY45DRAFT_1108179 [Cubamyces sp. BRFM 1775]